MTSSISAPISAAPTSPATPRRSTRRSAWTPAQVDRLEREIDAMNAGLAPLRSFVLPGGSPLAAHLHLCRTVCRRAERLATALAGEEDVNPAALKYLNRLSDWFFVASRAANDGGAGDVLWVPGGEPLRAVGGPLRSPHRQLHTKAQVSNVMRRGQSDAAAPNCPHHTPWPVRPARAAPGLPQAGRPPTSQGDQTLDVIAPLTTRPQASCSARPGRARPSALRSAR